MSTMMYGIDHDIFLRPMDGSSDMELVDNLTIDEILNLNRPEKEGYVLKKSNDEEKNELLYKSGDRNNVSLHQDFFETLNTVEEEPIEEPKIIKRENMIGHQRNFNGNMFTKYVKQDPYSRSFGNNNFTNGFTKPNPMKTPYNSTNNTFPTTSNFTSNVNEKIDYTLPNPPYQTNDNFSNGPFTNFMNNSYILPNNSYNIQNNFNVEVNENIDYTVPISTYPSENGVQELSEEDNVTLNQTSFILNEDGSKKRKSLDSFETEEEEDETKLPPSKTPIIDAILYCAIKGDSGINIEYRDDSKIYFKVTDYDRFYEKQKRVCSKQNPTDDESSRIKTIQRWFKNFPTKKERSKTNQTVFYFSVEKSVSEDKFKKILKIMEKLECSINVNKRRRTK